MKHDAAPTIKLCFISDPTYIEHLTGYGHPEQPARITAINSALEKGGLKDKDNSISPRLAKVEEISLCHDLSYIQIVERETAALQNQQITGLSTGDVEISRNSFLIAQLAVGGVLTAVDQVFTDKASKAFCIVRPPGHHASRAKGAGFCIFNNVAVAARYAQQKYKVERVLIVDWDVHHGDGTQAIFYSDPSVFYFSTHEAGNYPFSGRADEIGEKEGKGFNMNVPIPGSRLLNSRKGTGHLVIKAFQEKLTRAMEDFKPEFILISCGFDGHQDDPLGGFDLTDEDFTTLTLCVNQIANNYAKGKIVSVLEGGYNLHAIASASLAHTKALLST